MENSASLLSSKMDGSIDGCALIVGEVVSTRLLIFELVIVVVFVTVIHSDYL